MTEKKRIFLLAVLLWILPPVFLWAQTRDLINENPYLQETGKHMKKGGAYFKKDSSYFKKKSAYFPGKSRYFVKENAYVKNNEPNLLERFFNSIKSAF